MPFVTYSNWEIKDDLYRKVSGVKGIKIYQSFKPTLNLQLFLINVEYFDVHELKLKETFFFDDINMALKFIDKDDFIDATISLLSRRCDNKDNNYSISDLNTIYQGDDQNGDISYIFKCNDNRTYLNSLSAEKENDIKNKELIYYKEIL